MKQFLEALFWFKKHFGKRSLLSLGLFILQGFFQGVSIMLVLPLLALTGIKGLEGVADNSLAKNAKYFFEWIHLPLNLPIVLLLFVTLIFLHSGLKYWSTLLNAKISQDFANCQRKALHQLIMEAEWKTLFSVKNSDMVGMLSREISQVSYGITILMQMVGAIVLLLTHLAIAFFIAPEITFYILLIGTLLTFIQRKLFSKSLQNGRRNLHFLKALQNTLQEHFQNIKLAKAQNLNNSQKERLNRISDEMFVNQVAFTRTKATTDFSYDAGSAVLLSVFLYVVLTLFSAPVLNIVLLLYVFSRVLPALKSILTQFQQFLNIVPIIHDIKEKGILFSENNENGGKEELQKAEFRKQLSFQNVSFSYPGEKIVLTDFSFSISFGKITAIVGASGTGKSTVADLITGILKPDKGQILLDGIPLEKVGYKNWRNSIAYMTQERMLFHDSIRNNLLWSNPEASESELWKALEQANAKNFVEQLPNGLGTVIGDRGTKLSGGQRQRLALAMALVRKPQLLIMDEATSELDEQNEKEIYETLFPLKEKMTIVLITHRLKTLELVDDKVVFNV